MKSAIMRRLQQACIIVAIISGGLIMGALTPAYSQDDGTAAAGATSTR